jgi:hypothetical protein
MVHTTTQPHSFMTRDEVKNTFGIQQQQRLESHRSSIFINLHDLLHLQ